MAKSYGNMGTVKNGKVFTKKYQVILVDSYLAFILFDLRGY